MQLPEHIRLALDEYQIIIGTYKASTENHTAWCKIWKQRSDGLYPLKKNNKVAEYIVDWVEMSDETLENYRQGSDLDAETSASSFLTEFAFNLEELEQILFQKIEDEISFKIGHQGYPS